MTSLDSQRSGCTGQLPRPSFCRQLKANWACPLSSILAELSRGPPQEPRRARELAAALVQAHVLPPA